MNVDPFSALLGAVYVIAQGTPPTPRVVEPFTDTVGQWWTWFRIVVVCVALVGALHAWAKPALTGVLDTDRRPNPTRDPANVGSMKRMLTMVSIAAGVWWLTGDSGIAVVETLFRVGEATATDTTNVSSPFVEGEFVVDRDLFKPASTVTTSR